MRPSRGDLGADQVVQDASDHRAVAASGRLQDQERLAVGVERGVELGLAEVRVPHVDQQRGRQGGVGLRRAEVVRRLVAVEVGRHRARVRDERLADAGQLLDRGPDVELAVAISHEVAVTVQRLRLLDKARAMTHLATADRLTGLHNRRHFLTLAEQEFHRARRYRRPLSALVLDIDSFKTVNEQHGHAAGDQVLRTVADSCSANLREPNLLCRFGDDQFVVLLLECDHNGARVVADRLLRQVVKR